ncbi:nitroreductase [Candidatus Bathyarchaeota archaeon]|nr:MAG: nitroreductase [Candidatus Bathyarchaeota archaeon]
MCDLSFNSAFPLLKSVFMELDEAIRGRRSVRSYIDRPVSLGLVREVLEAATWAPSAKNGQQWRFTVLTGAAKRRLTDLFRSELQALSEKIGAERMGSSFASCRVMKQASVLIMVWNINERGWATEEHSVAAAIQNMLLKAHSLGLGTLWIGDIYYALDSLTRHLGKPWKLVAAIALGWPAKTPKPPPRLTVDQVTEFLR